MTNQKPKNIEKSSYDDNVSEGELEMSALQNVLGLTALGMSYLRRLTVFVPIFGVVFLAIGFMWFQAVQEERSLKAESVSMRVLLDLPVPQPEMLLNEASGWETAYKVVFEKRTARSADSDLIGGIIRAAESSGLKVVETGTTDDGVVTLENDKYTVTPVLIKSTGNLDEIEQFLRSLESSKFSSFEVQSTMFEAQFIGYILTVRGVFYSLPEDYSDQLVDEEDDVPVIPVGIAGAGEVSP